jgi:hypothetical protein
MIARKNPVKAPRNASVIERRLNVRNPWLVRMNPVYAIAIVQRTTRTENMGSPLDEQILPQFALVEGGFSAVYRKDCHFDISDSCLLNP